MNVLDLFSGIGGFSLGLERVGMKTVSIFVRSIRNAKRYCKKHWPDVPIFNDVSNLTGEEIGKRIKETIDVIVGGFPCQDISLAGNGEGLEGKRSGLWSEFHRLIKEIKPKYAIIENVSALRSRGLDQVLRSLSEIGYDAEWNCIPASAFGAPHRRDRNLDYGVPQTQWRGGSNLIGIKKALDEGHLKRPSGHPIQIRLQDQVKEPRLWPTPTASDHKGAATPEAVKTWEKRGHNLPEAVQL